MHPRVSGALGREIGDGKRKKRLIPRYIFSGGGVWYVGRTQACALIEGIAAEYLLADRGYGSREIIERALTEGDTGGLSLLGRVESSNAIRKTYTPSM